MRVLVVLAHPSPKSFVGALRRRIVEELVERGHEVDNLDLYAEKFDPVLPAETYAVYIDPARNTKGVENYVSRLRATEALVVIYPVWFDGLPAILQGYFQRVFLPGVATFIDADGLFHANLQNLRRVTGVAAYGEIEPQVVAKGDPARRFLRDNIGVLMGPEGVFDYHAIYGMDFAKPADREAFLQRLTQAFSQW